MKKYISGEKAYPIEYRGYIIQWSQWDGVYYIIKDSKVVGSAPNDKEAREWIDGSNPIRGSYFNIYSRDPDYDIIEGQDEIVISFEEPIDLNADGWYTFRNQRLAGATTFKNIYSDDGVIPLTDNSTALSEIIDLLETDEYTDKFDLPAGPYQISGIAHLVYNTQRYESSELSRERAEYDPSGNFIGYIDEISYNYLDGDPEDAEFRISESWIEDFEIIPLK